MNLALVLAFLFFIGSTLGWVLELLYRNLTQRNKKWVNPEFWFGHSRLFTFCEYT